jgi:plasmid stabilization system protein ParE
MGCKVILTPLAVEDLRAIVEFIATDNPNRARSFGEELVDKALGLGEWPKVGRQVPEIGDEAVREVIHGPYRIVYKIYTDAKVVRVARFWHAARGVPNISPNA